METRHLHPLLQFLYPSAISNAIAEIRCIRFLPAADGSSDLASQIETSRVLPSLSSICQSSHDLTLHCLECISLPECSLVFQQSSKVLLGNCLGVVCVIKWQCLKSTFEWQCLKPETCSLETDPCDVLHICKVVQLISYNVVWPSQILQLTWKSLHWGGWEPD